MRKFMLIVGLMVGLLMAFPVLADDMVYDPGDNWCFDGGPLEGRCTTDDPATTHWLWMYGFFRAQVAKGALSVSDIPEEYRTGLQDSASQNTAAIRDADGNIIAGQSANFQGTISTCRFTDNHLYITVIWVGLDIAGDRIEISTDEGSVSKDMYLPTMGVDYEFRIGDPAEEITPDGIMSIYYRGVLIGRSDLNGLFDCENDT